MNLRKVKDKELEEAVDIGLQSFVYGVNMIPILLKPSKKERLLNFILDPFVVLLLMTEMILCVCCVMGFAEWFVPIIATIPFALIFLFTRSDGE